MSHLPLPPEPPPASPTASPGEDAPPCPHCAEPLRRVRRDDWMRVLPSSKRYRCPACYKTYLAIAGKLFGGKRQIGW